MKPYEHLALTGSLPETARRSVADYLAEWQEDAREERAAGGLEFPWRQLNDAFGSKIRKGELLVMGARPGVGKSYGVTEFVRHNLIRRHDLSGLIFSLEMRGSVVAGRAAAIALGIREREARLMVSEPDAADARLIADDNPWMRRLYVHEKRVRVDEIEQTVRDYGNPAIVIVDYLGLVQGVAPGQREYERVSAAILECQQAALTTGSVMIVAAQLRRRDDGGDGQEFVAPRAEDLKSSGDIEAAADRIVGLWRERTDPSVMYARVLKNRHGMRRHDEIKLLQTESGAIVDYA